MKKLKMTEYIGYQLNRKFSYQSRDKCIHSVDSFIHMAAVLLFCGSYKSNPQIKNHPSTIDFCVLTHGQNT